MSIDAASETGTQFLGLHQLLLRDNLDSFHPWCQNVIELFAHDHNLFFLLLGYSFAYHDGG